MEHKKNRELHVHKSVSVHLLCPHVPFKHFLLIKQILSTKRNSLCVKGLKRTGCCVWPSLGWVFRTPGKKIPRENTSKSGSKIPVGGGGVTCGTMRREPFKSTSYNNLITKLHGRQKAAGATGCTQGFPVCTHVYMHICGCQCACLCLRVCVRVYVNVGCVCVCMHVQPCGPGCV